LRYARSKVLGLVGSIFLHTEHRFVSVIEHCAGFCAALL